MHTIDDLKAGYRKFRTGAYKAQAEHYRELGEGQDPDVMVIACADSRVEPADIFATKPGQLFVVRNVANLVPPYEETEGLHGVSAALEFAVTALKVKHIVVMGHASCGGVGASLSAANDRPVGQFIAPWVKLLDEARDAVLATSPEDAQTALEHAGITASLENLKTFSFVRDAMAAGSLHLHGAWFSIGQGELRWRNPDSGVFEEIEV